jgi:3D (Asp-Asp-Asp) domain-containing protein
MTGLVERVDLEGGCTVLRADTNQTYELMGGDPNVVKHGSRVTVTGKIRSDLSTICQMGPVLEVTSSQPA